LSGTSKGKEKKPVEKKIKRGREKVFSSEPEKGKFSEEDHSSK